MITLLNAMIDGNMEVPFTTKDGKKIMTFIRHKLLTMNKNPYLVVNSSLVKEVKKVKE